MIDQETSRALSQFIHLGHLDDSKGMLASPDEAPFLAFSVAEVVKTFGKFMFEAESLDDFLYEILR